MEVPELFQASFLQQFSQENRRSDTRSSAGDHFVVEDLLDFSNHEAVPTEGTSSILAAGNSTEPSTMIPVDSSNSSPFSSGDAQFSSDLCVPCDDLAELEWLSNFMEDSFSSEDFQELQMISAANTQTHESSTSAQKLQSEDVTRSMFTPNMSVPAKARSKRSRVAPCNWTSRLLSVQSQPDAVKGLNSEKKAAKKKDGTFNGEGRKCLHCATEKTPQWRAGPMGPKTLCNACGVRYKSGRLVPEYRPAASPTFVLTKHSNSHRKVMELRRQKELLRTKQQQQRQGFNGEDYLIQQQMGPDFSQLMI